MFQHKLSKCIASFFLDNSVYSIFHSSNCMFIVCRYYDLEKWEAKRQKKSELKALKKARETSFSIVDDEKRHELLHRRVDSNKYGTAFIFDCFKARFALRLELILTILPYAFLHDPSRNSPVRDSPVFRQPDSPGWQKNSGHYHTKYSFLSSNWWSQENANTQRALSEIVAYKTYSSNTQAEYFSDNVPYLAGPSRQQLLEMQQELRRRQDEEYKKKAGIS